MALWRRIMLWAIPGVLLAALAWSLIPHAGPPAAPTAAGRADGEAGRRTPPAATPDDRPSGGEAHQPGGAPPAGAQPPAASPQAGAPSGEIRAGTLVGTDDAGRRRWQIVADDVLLAQGRQMVLLRNVRATFYDPDGTAMTVTGQRGRYDTATREVDLDGDVHGVSGNGREMFADRLHYSPASASVTGTGHVRVVEERVIMYSDRVVSDTTLGQTRFFGHVHMTVR